MRTYSKMLIGLAVVTALTVGGFFAYVAGAEPAEVAPRFDRLAERWAALGVTDEQKAEVKEILRQYQPTVQPLIQQFVVERRTLRELVHAETVDEAAIRAQVKKSAKVGADLAVARAHVAHDIRGVLTPEQIKQLAEMTEDVDARIDHFLDRVAKRITED